MTEELEKTSFFFARNRWSMLLLAFYDYWKIRERLWRGKLKILQNHINSGSFVQKFTALLKEKISITNLESFRKAPAETFWAFYTLLFVLLAILAHHIFRVCGVLSAKNAICWGFFLYTVCLNESFCLLISIVSHRVTQNNA